MLDLSLAVFRAQVLSQAARQGARAAIVRGEYADQLGIMGPSTLSGNASASDAVSTAVRNQLVAVSANDVSVRAEWIDAGNKVEDRVRVTVSATYTPVITYVFGQPTWTLQASSTMSIAH
jgi:hypothetical protein